MSKSKLTVVERLHRSVVAAVSVFCIFALARKLGFRGKFQPWDPSTSWGDVAAVLPSFAILSLLVGGAVYFWLGRRSD